MTFAINRLVLLIPNSNPGNITSVYSLRSGGRKLSIGTAGVPIGAYTRQLLKRMRLSSILSSNTVSQQTNVGQVSSQVALGAADAGFVYYTDGLAVKRPHEDDQPAQVGPAAGALPDLHRAPSGGRHGRRGGLHQAGHGQGRPRRAEGLRLRVAAARSGAARGAFTALLALFTGITLAFLAIPIVALFTEVPLRDVPGLLRKPAVQDALAVTLRTNLIANALILGFGTPTAWFIARRRFPGRALVVTLVELPLVLPPAVAGIGLLAAVGTGGLFGSALRDAGIELPFTEAAVVLAVAFVASPFYIRQAISAFESVDPNLTDAARTLGAGPGRTFWRIGLPLAASGLLAGWVLAFARGVGSSARRSSSPATCAARRRR